MRFPAGVTVTVLRTGGRDERGNPQPETEHPVSNCFISPRASEEAGGRSDLTVTGAVLRGPVGADIISTDRIRVPDGHPMAGVWSIEGDVGPYQSPFSGWAPGFRVALTKEG